MNTNPDAKRILIFGDSLSWGYIPSTDHERYPTNVRWPGKLQEMLGNDFEIIEENLISRAIENDDSRPGKEGRKSLEYIIPCLDSHDPLDFVVVLLGTNELKEEYGQTKEMIGKSIENLLRIIINRSSQFRPVKPKVILMSPPNINEKTEYALKQYRGAAEKLKRLSDVYKKVANDLKIDFISLETIKVGDDGVHIDEKAHQKIAEWIKNYIEETT